MGKATRRIRDAGRIVEVVQYSHVKKTDGPAVRQAKKKKTSAVMQAWNNKSSTRKFELMLAANYRPGDVLGTLTFDDDHLPSSKAEVDRRFKYWREKIRKRYMADGLDPVIFWRVEHRHGDGRWHVHFILTATGNDYEKIRSSWIYGPVQDYKSLRVDEEKNYRTIAEYLTKERPDKLGQRGWSYTRNARKPQEEWDVVEEDDAPVIPEGVIVLESTVSETQYGRHYYHRYMLQPNVCAPRVRARRRRRRKKPR